MNNQTLHHIVAFKPGPRTLNRFLWLVSAWGCGDRIRIRKMTLRRNLGTLWSRDGETRRTHPRLSRNAWRKYGDRSRKGHLRLYNCAVRSYSLKTSEGEGRRVRKAVACVPGLSLRNMAMSPHNDGESLSKPSTPLITFLQDSLPRSIFKHWLKLAEPDVDMVIRT
jgi:hypothetical protein